MSKKYFWLKFPQDFFHQKEIKKLRKIAGGDTYVVIYTRLLLLSIPTEGIITYDGVEESFAEELALVLDEDVENVKVTLLFLQKYKLIEEINDNSFLLVSSLSMLGSESTSAERVRRHRDKKALHCNTEVTVSNTEVTVSNTEKRREEIEKKREDIDIEKIVKKPKKDIAKEFLNKQIEVINEYTDDPLLRVALEEFIEHRKGIKKPFRTIDGIKGIVRKLKSFGYTGQDALQCLQNAREGQWEGVWEFNTKPKPKPKPAQPKLTDPNKVYWQGEIVDSVVPQEDGSTIVTRNGVPSVCIV